MLTKLDITASDKPKQQEFSYSLEISEGQMLTTVAAVCGTVLLPTLNKGCLKNKNPLLTCKNKPV
nr:hypothetical protein [Streptococcus sp. 'caviae']